jgi:hypothetical protein
VGKEDIPAEELVCPLFSKVLNLRYQIIIHFGTAEEIDQFIVVDFLPAFD